MLRRLVVAALAVALFVTCKQNEGDRCQVDGDCESPLVCAQATHTCESSVSVDGSIQPDANVDAGVGIDGATDAPSDAAADAAADAPTDAATDAP